MSRLPGESRFPGIVGCTSRVIFTKSRTLSNRENSQEFAVWSWSSCELLTHNAWNAGHCVVCVMSGQTSDVWECWLPWFFGWTIVSANRKFRHGQCARAGWSVTRQGRASPVSVRPNEAGLDVNACLKQAERRSPHFPCRISSKVGLRILMG